MNKSLSFACAVAAPILFSQSAAAEFDYFKTDGSFKRFSVSAGWLHANPTGDATPVKNTTAIDNGYEAQNGSVKAGTVKDIIDQSQPQSVLSQLSLLNGIPNNVDLNTINFPAGPASGKTVINGLESFATPGTGLEADDVDTVGLLFNYFIDDNWSVELKAGLPPKVDILGKGTVIAPFSGTASSPAIPTDFKVKKDIEITDLTQGSAASTARAWLPAAEVHYQFGKSGVDKFRPYVGAGLMYAYFNDIELNSGIAKDLAAAGHMIQNIKDNKAGASLEGIPSDSGMKLKVEADSAWAPIVTVGATYDFDESWFAVGSVSYAKLDSDTTITVKNDDGEQLIKAVSNIDIDPYITYLGVGYRF